MSLIKRTVFFLVFFMSLNFSFAEGFFDKNDDFNFYVNNPVPTVNVTLKIPTEDLIVKSASLWFNGQKSLFDFPDVTVPAGVQTYIKSVSLSEFSNFTSITKDDNVVFELEVVSKLTGKKIVSTGEPTKFNIIFDNEVPTLISAPGFKILVSDINEVYRLQFSEKIAKIKISKNGKIFLNKPEFFTPIESNYESFFELFFHEDELIEGNNEFDITFEDFAGNAVVEKLNFVYSGIPIAMELVTRRDDSNLKYFYDSNFTEFFSNKIYHTEDNFDLIVKTNKPGKCALVSEFLNFVDVNDILDPTVLKEFTTTDDLTHTFSITDEKRIWVACIDKNFDENVVYLSESMGINKTLIYLEKYNKDFEITNFFPKTIVSSNPFNIEAQTSQDAICHYSIGSNNRNLFSDSNSYKTHLKKNVNLSNGDYTFKVECFDRVYNVETQTYTVSIDTSSGPKIVEPTGDIYLDSTSAPIKLVLSEDAVCKGSKTQVDVIEFESLSTIPGTGVNRDLSVSGLELGENEYYICCSKNGQIFSNSLNIVFDSNPPQISDLKFKNGDSESDYLRDNLRLDFSVDYDSYIPANYFEAEIVFSNYTERKNFSKGKGSFKEVLDNAKNFKITAYSILGKKSNTLQKPIKIDRTPPVLAFSSFIDHIKISCIDSESGCHKIYYGFSQTSINCVASKLYAQDDEILIEDHNYICARAMDYVGNNEEIIEAINGYTPGNEGGDSWKEYNNFNQTDSNNDFEDGEDDNNQNNVDDNPFRPTPTDPTPDESGNGLIIAAIIIVLLGGIGGGGYYAYREGYLDKQLEKFGIKRPQTVKSNGNYYSGINKNGNNKTGSKVSAKKTGYDRNLKKLHNFIDDTLTKDDDVFDTFGSTGKGKVEGFEDTLAKKNKSKKKNSSFVEFSNDSKNLGGVKNSKDSNSIEKEAEEFENYFKEKDKKKTTNKKE